MAASRYVLCRRDRSDIGAAPVYCCKPITRPNALDWCQACRDKVLPLWPPEAAEPVMCLKGGPAHSWIEGENTCGLCGSSKPEPSREAVCRAAGQVGPVGEAGELALFPVQRRETLRVTR